MAAPPVRGRRRRPLRRFLAGLTIIGALALILWLAESRTGWDALDADTRAEAAARFSDEASRIAARPVTIDCDESGDYVGAVQHADDVAAVGGDLAYLTPERRLDLYRLAFKREVTSSETARAFAVLAHEAWHLGGVRDEGTTECYALQAGVEIGQRLGLSEDTARRMMRQQLAENALRIRASPTTSCRRSPASPRFGVRTTRRHEPKRPTRATGGRTQPRDGRSVPRRRDGSLCRAQTRFRCHRAIRPHLPTNLASVLSPALTSRRLGGLPKRTARHAL